MIPVNNFNKVTNKIIMYMTVIWLLYDCYTVSTNILDQFASRTLTLWGKKRQETLGHKTIIIAGKTTQWKVTL